MCRCVGDIYANAGAWEKVLDYIRPCIVCVVGLLSWYFEFTKTLRGKFGFKETAWTCVLRVGLKPGTFVLGEEFGITKSKSRAGLGSLSASLNRSPSVPISQEAYELPAGFR